MTLTGIMMLCSCATKTITSDNLAALTGRWAIVEAMQKGVEGADKAPFIQFKADGQINGNASVNSFFGSPSGRPRWAIKITLAPFSIR